jgi:hypothetical protein
MDVFEKLSYVVLPALITAFFASIIQRKLKERQRFLDAAAVFRGKVLSELEGLYPVSNFWEEKLYPKFRQSIPKIETAAVEFRHFVKRKEEFDAAIREYRDYCWKVTYGGVSGWHMYTSMRKPGDIGPVETFKNLVEGLFTFTARK